MKKRIATLVLCVIFGLSAFVLPLIAYASDTAQIDAILTIDPPPVSTPSSTYIINIPSSINLNNESSVYITWSDYDIGSNQSVVVSIDGDETFSDDGYFYLHNPNGNTDDYRLLCFLERGSRYSGFSDRIDKSSDKVVAVFQNHSQEPVSFGRLYFSYMQMPFSPAGTYTGTVYFKIELTTV